ncbi:RNA-directed DNA polymerase [Apilactobacillus apisilvae]|uniref:RNA-directed DNA polymerase n=1 Tax=Apilactobacillus apisilvae TaxID=2923364 RepID=A0ABY4PHB6_9LACO|nr:RNA-directed DNA polymerase [Apilactobacillus apisilvae]UQS84856.1 RNA-directed DNA polymerase [Apilactobacillus apisilvae]
MSNNYFLRTDVLPEELPIPFSNKQLYKNITEKDVNNYLTENYNKKVLDVKDGTIPLVQQSIPLKFKVDARTDKIRNIGLIHPLAQLQVLFFVIKYERMILLSTEKSNFSVRKPVNRNKNQIDELKAKKKKIKELKDSFIPKSRNLISSEELIKQYRNYFSFSKCNSISELFKSSEFINSQENFLHMQKIDIQNFFPSIYTHSLSWALFGSKKIAKINKNINSFENNVDKIIRRINYDETNGIIIGPEFSRIIAELILCQIDREVEKDLYNDNIKNNKEYKIFRFIDDTFIFYNSDDVINKIIQTIKSKLAKYNLDLNENKIKKFSLTTSISVSPITKVKIAIDTFKRNKYINAQKKNIDEKDFRGTNNDWNLLFEQIIEISSNNPKDKTKIINYFLESLSGIIIMKPTNNNIANYLKTINKVLRGITDLIKISFTQKTLYKSYFLVIKIINQIKEGIKNNNLQNYEKDFIVPIFIFISKLISFNWFDITQGYDFITISKFFIKYNLYLNSYKLISFIKSNKNSYFIMSTIAYYIYDNKNKSVFKNYITVKNVLYRTIKSTILNYKLKGSLKELWFDSEWFYFSNDFSKYPGFKQEERQCFIDNFKNTLKKAKYSNTTKILFKESYYNWNLTFDDISKKLFYKKVINKIENNIIY